MFYQFPDESSFSALLPEGLTLDGPDGGNAKLTISVIGSISGTTGWHVNAIGEVPDSWQAFEVFPTTPMRVFG